MIKLSKLILFFFLYPFKKIITPKNVIIFSSNSPYRYGGGPKFLFEYLSKKKFNSFWWTKDKNVKKYLEKKKLNYFSFSNPLLFLKVIFSAKIIINSGDDHFDFCYLLKNDKRVKKICTGHGIGPKLVNNHKKHPLSINFDFISYASEFSAKYIAKKQFKIAPDKIKLLGNPKNDLFFDKLKVENIHNKKKIAKFYIKKFKKNSKIIFYAPTWRPYTNNLPLYDLKNFNLNKFNSFLKENDYYFFYNKHILSNEIDIINTDRIKFVSNKSFSLFDTNEMLCESDIFCTDCSTLSTEAAILKKPQIMIFPDFKKFQRLRGFIEPFEKIIPSNIIYDFNIFLKTINSYKNKQTYNKKFNKKIAKYLDHYYDVNINNSLLKHQNFINKIFKNQ